MSMMDNVKNIGAVVAAITIGYGVVIKAGWVIGRAEAEDINKASMVALELKLTQVIAQEEQARRDADLEFQLDLALQRLQFLLSIDDRDAAQDAEIEQIKNKISRIEAKLEGEA